MSPSQPVSKLDSHVGYWLRIVSNHVSHGFAQKVEAQGVTVAEWVLMRALFDADGEYPSQLALTLGLTRGAVSKLSSRLEAKGLVERLTILNDKRYQRLRLTPDGRHLVPLLARLADENDHEFFHSLGAEGAEQLVGLLKAVCHDHGLRAAPVS